MAGSKSQFLERSQLSRLYRLTTTTVSASNLSTTNVLVTSSANFSVGDFIQITATSTFHQVTAIPDSTHLTITPATASAVTTGSMQAKAYSPIGVWIALFTTNPTETGDSATEVTGGSYVRVQITQADASWTLTATGLDPQFIQNANAIPFATPSAGWGAVRGIGFYDASTGGNLLHWAPFDAAAVVNSGDPAPNIAIGAITIRET